MAVTVSSKGKKKNELVAKTIVEVEQANSFLLFPAVFKKHIQSVINRKHLYIGGSALVASSFIANVLNYIFNAYLGRILSFEDFALIGLISSFYSFATIFFGAYSTTINFKSSYLIGKHGDSAGYMFWKHALKQVIYPSVIVAAVWLLGIPFLMQFFHTNNIYLFLLFGLVLLVGFASNVNQGFLAGRMMFGSLAVISLTDPLIKLATIVILVLLGLKIWSFSAIPLAILLVFAVTWMLIFTQVKRNKVDAYSSEAYNFSRKFFLVSLISGVATVAYFTFDIFLAKHFLTPVEAGKYVLLALVGKMIFFLGNLTAPFIIPLIGRYEGAKKNSVHALYILLAFTCFLVLVGFLLFGVFGFFTVPLLYGAKAHAIVPYLIYYTFGMGCYTLSNVFINYYLVRRVYTFPIVSSFLIFFQVLFIVLFHESIKSIALVMAFILLANLVVSLIMHLQIYYVKQVEKFMVYSLKKFIKQINKSYIYNIKGVIQKLFVHRNNNI